MGTQDQRPRLALDDETLAALLELQRLRSEGTSSRLAELEARLAAEFRVDRHLAVYGSLAPGRENHEQLRELCGDWAPGFYVHGDLVREGWGDELGYPALRWSMSGARVPVELFTSDDLPAHWERLDAFEGPDYLRIVVPVHASEGIVALANLYAVRP